MAVRVITWAIDQQNLDPTTKLILILLADIADETGKCWPGQQRLAQIANVSVRSIKTHIAALKGAGLLEAKRRFGTSQVYQLSYGQNLPDSNQRLGSQHPHDGEANCLSMGKPTSHYPSEEPSDTRQKGNRGTRLPEDWTVHPDDIEWARDNLRLTTETISFQVDEFKDYWRGVPGERGRKCDWRATFRNSLRRWAGRTKAEIPDPLRPRSKVLPGGKLEFKPEPKKMTAEEWRAKRANGKAKDDGAPLPVRKTQTGAGDSLPHGVHHGKSPT